MTFTDVYTDIYHDTYGKPADVLIPPDLPPAPGALLTVNVRNNELEFVGKLKYTRAEARAKHNELGTWAFDIFHSGTPDEPAAALIAPGAGVSIAYNGKVILSGPATAAKQERNADGTYLLSVSGTDDKQWFVDRYGSPEPVKVIPDDGGVVAYDEQSHFTFTGPAESAIKALIEVNLATLARPARQLFVETIPSNNRGDDVTVSTRFDPLLETIITAAEQGGVGLDARQIKEGVITFDVYVPADKTDEVRFIDTSKYVESFSYERQRPTGTWVAVGGGGEGTGRVFWESGVDSEWGRIERFRDQRQTENAFELAAEAFKFLDENGDKFSFSCDLIDSPDAPFRWAPAVTETGIGTFDLGDQVTIVVNGVPLAQIVREIRVVDDENGLRLTPVVGTPNQSDPRDRYVKALFDRIRDLEGRLGYQERGL